ncbi:MAG: ABC transporter permease [Candidatus Marinimicrobia bacterium]|nr:ABC transporter permease [Candidatus Neomarinimicrobiota bacterium]
MNFEEGLRLAYQTVKSNKLRTFLTTLGIVIGVMAVIGMMSIIDALERHMTQTLSAVGGSVFWVQKYPAVRIGHLDRKYRNRKNITVEHARAVKRLAKAVGAVSPEFYTLGKQIKYKDESTNPNIIIYGGDENWAEVNDRYISEGRLFIKEDIYHKRYVAVIGSDIVEKLFPFSYPVGERIKIGNIRFEVVGVIDKKGEIFGNTQDNLVTIPYSTFRKVFGTKRTINIGIKAKSVELIPEAIDQTISALRIARKVPPGAENDFEIVTQDSIMDTLKNLTGFVFIAAVVICGISLLVGGIGIMNIMLVSVTERTREIGIRKAIGAKRKHILFQFMTESIGICIFGGIIGVILGVVVGLFISAALKLPPTIPVWSIFLGLGFSLLIGVVFGVYPAMKAARLDPIEALRHE